MQIAADAITYFKTIFLGGQTILAILKKEKFWIGGTLCGFSWFRTLNCSSNSSFVPIKILSCVLTVYSKTKAIWPMLLYIIITFAIPARTLQRVWGCEFIFTSTWIAPREWYFKCDLRLNSSNFRNVAGFILKLIFLDYFLSKHFIILTLINRVCRSNRQRPTHYPSRSPLLFFSVFCFLQTPSYTFLSFCPFSGTRATFILDTGEEQSKSEQPQFAVLMNPPHLLKIARVVGWLMVFGLEVVPSKVSAMWETATDVARASFVLRADVRVSGGRTGIGGFLLEGKYLVRGFWGSWLTGTWCWLFQTYRTNNLEFNTSWVSDRTMRMLNN